MRALLPLALALAGCGRVPAPQPSENPLAAPPVDSVRVGSAREAAAWAYRRATDADLDGDGRSERIVIAADVAVSGSGEPLWEDGHRWAVYVEPARGPRTLLYAAFVPSGFAEAAVLTADAAGRRTVLVQERTPWQIRALEIAYAGPGAAESSSSAYYQVERWVPGSAGLALPALAEPGTAPARAAGHRRAPSARSRTPPPP